jgi:hypothetical protein
MTMNVKIVGLQKLGYIVIDFRVNKNRPYDGFFGFSVMRNAWRGGGGCFFRG